MPVINSAWEVDASPDAVWDFSCDVERYPEWVVPTDEMLATPEGELCAGSTYRESGGIGPFKGKSDWTVTEFEAPRRQVHEGDDGMVRIHLTIDLAATEHGTHINQRIQLTPRWFIAPLFYATWPLFMRRKAQAAMDQTGANMKRILEADA